MDKQQFEEFKRQNNFAAIAYQYWREHKINTYVHLTEGEFIPLFLNFVARNEGGTIVTPSQQVKRINGQEIMYKVISFYEERFKNEVWKMKGQ